MQLNELPGQGQSEPGPLDLLVRRPHLPELLEDRLLVLGCDTYASVSDGDLGHAVVDRSADVDPAALGCELEGIGEQVQEDLFHFALVAADHAHAVVDGPPQPDPAPAHPLTDEGESVVDGRGEVKIRNLQL